MENGEKKEEETADVGEQREIGLLQHHVLQQRQRKQGEGMKKKQQNIDVFMHVGVGVHIVFVQPCEHVH